MTAAAVAAGGEVAAAAGLVTGAAVAAGPDGVDSKVAANSVLAMPAVSANNGGVTTQPPSKFIAAPLLQAQTNLLRSSSTAFGVPLERQVMIVCLRACGALIHRRFSLLCLSAICAKPGHF